MVYDTSTPTAPSSRDGDRDGAPDDPVSTAVLEDAQRAVREGPAVPDADVVRDAVRSSERTDGAAVTEARLRDGTLLGDDGTPVLGGAGPGAWAEAADRYVSDLSGRAGAAVPALDETALKFEGQHDLVRGHLATYYADPDRAIERLRGLDDAGISTLVSGDDRVLGEPAAGAPAGGLRVDALLAHRDVISQFPDEAQRVEAGRDHERARELMREFDDGERTGQDSLGQDPNASHLARDRGGDPGVPGGPNPVAEPGHGGGDLVGAAVPRMVAYAMSPGQI